MVKAQAIKKLGSSLSQLAQPKQLKQPKQLTQPFALQAPHHLHHFCPVAFAQGV